LNLFAQKIDKTIESSRYRQDKTIDNLNFSRVDPRKVVYGDE